MAKDEKKSPIAKKEGKKGLGVGEAIADILKKSKRKTGMTVEMIDTAMMKTHFDESKMNTVKAQLGVDGSRILREIGCRVEVIPGDTAADRCYKFVEMIDEDEMKQLRKEYNASLKARKAAKAEAGDLAPEEEEEMTKAEKKAAKKAAKKAKKAAKKDK